MATSLGTETSVLTKEERTSQINIVSPKGEDPTITVYRDLVKTDAQGVIQSAESIAVVKRLGSAVMADSFTAAGATVTGAQLAALIAKAGDQWHAEDKAAAAAQEA
jgi:hypothetical protein